MTSATAPTSVWDAVYTVDQVQRGDSVYQKTCKSCHGAELKGGDDGAPLAGPEFMKSYDGKLLDAMFLQIRNSMPPTDPKSIPRPLVADVMAYMLSRNHFPAGSAPLTDDIERLHQIRFHAVKP